ncbi:9875_t:CDS:10, partial [Acaulospora colombiana]
FSAPGGMATYRKSLVGGFMYKFWYDVSKSVGIETANLGDEDFTGIIERNVSKGLQVIGQPEEEMKFVGSSSIPHTSAMKQATGEAIYTDDMPKVHDELYGALVISKYARARIVSIDASEALVQPGVQGFFTAKDVPGNNIWGPVFKDEEVFASKEEAVDLVKVEYEILPHVLTIEEAIEHDSFYPITRNLSNGDIEKGFQEADFVFEGETRVGGQEHFYLETQASLVIPKPEDGEIEIHASTQNPTETQLVCASVLGIAANKIVCRVKRLGGGFGDEDIVISGQRHPFLGRWKVGVDKHGKLLALDLQIYINAGWSSDISIGVLDRGMTHSDNCYHIPNVRIVGKMCKTNIHSNTAFRGFGAPQGMMICENIMCEIADRLGIDVVELREKNLYSEGQKTPFNQTLTDWHIPELFQQVKECADYENRRKQVDDFNSRNRWRKKGLSLVPTKFGLSFTAFHLNQAGALVHIYRDGSVLVSHGGVEMGQGLHTKMLQIAAETLNVPLENVHLMETSTNVVINTSPTAASVSSDLNGYAVANACKTLAERLKPYREKHPDKDFKEIIQAAYLDRVNLSANGFYKTPDIDYDWDKNEGQMYFYFTMGVACTEVEMDTLTGDHTILRTDLVMDIGRSLNYAVDIGQIEGAFVQGAGWCTIEETLYFPNGHVFTKGPGNYKLPGFRDIPQDFRVYTFKGEFPNLKTIHSSKGVGEPPLFLGSSVFFAIRDAIKSARYYVKNGKPVLVRDPYNRKRFERYALNKKRDPVYRSLRNKKFIESYIKVDFNLLEGRKGQNDSIILGTGESIAAEKISN